MNDSDVMAMNATYASRLAATGPSSWRGLLRSFVSLDPGMRHEQPGAANIKLLDLTHDAVSVRGLDGIIQQWSRGAEELYGWTADEAVGRVSHIVFKTIFPEALDEIEARVLRTGSWEGELVHARRDGSRVTVASRWSLLRDASSQPIAILEANSDITERGRAQAERRELVERLRQAEKLEAVGRFASGIAHDFNNVLHGIIAYGEMLLEEAPDAKNTRYAQNVLTAAERGRGLVEQVLGYTRGMRGTPAPTDACASVAETLEILRASVPASVSLVASIPDTPVVVMGSATQLHQVVMNLCGNSLQAMSTGGSLTVAITVGDVAAERALSHGTVKPGRYACVRVVDTGCGMDEATLAHIFEPFFTTRQADRGTGLGLSLVRAIVTDLGGAIDVKSARGEGTSFSIYLPIAK